MRSVRMIAVIPTLMNDNFDRMCSGCRRADCGKIIDDRLVTVRRTVSDSQFRLIFIKRLIDRMFRVQCRIQIDIERRNLAIFVDLLRFSDLLVSDRGILVF